MLHREDRTSWKGMLRRKHRGGVLVFGLILLLILTILGVSGSQVSNMELRMASNALDKNRSFQEAEDARVAAELAAIAAADTLRGLGTFNCNTRGFFADPATAQTANCAGLATTIAGGDIRDLDWATRSATVDGNSDRYVVEYLGRQDWIPPTDTNRGTAFEYAPLRAYTFRLTVRGLGVDGGLTYVQAFIARL